MYYLNSFFLYSLLGFIMESTLYKNTDPSRTSGVLLGPITIVYGLGGLAIILINKYILPHLKTNKVLKVILSFIIYTIILTIIEGLSGYLCEQIFGVIMWNYTSKHFNFGKYVCLEMAPIWGLIAVLITYYLKPFFDKIIKNIPTTITYFFLLIFSLDIIITIITK